MVLSIRDIFDLVVYLYHRITSEDFDDLKKKAWLDTFSYFDTPAIEISEFCDKNVNLELNKLKNGIKEIEILSLMKKLVHLREITYFGIDPQQFILVFLNNLKEQMKTHSHFSKIIMQRIEYEGGNINPWEIDYQELVEACEKLTQKHLLKVGGKYDKNLYVERRIEEEFREFMSSNHKCFLVVDRAGMGKTNFACWIAEKYGKENPCIIISGNAILNHECDLKILLSKEITHFLGTPMLVEIDRLIEVVEIRNSICAELQKEMQEHRFLDIKIVLKSESRERKRVLLIIIDGINENENRKVMKNALQDLLCESAGKDVKFLITCREIFWEYFDDEFWKEFVYKSDKASERPWIYVTEFDNGQFNSAWGKYKSRYQIKGEIVSEAREKCKHPLMLRFFCEAYVEENIGLCRNFTKKEVFDKYWEKKLKRLENDLQYQYSRQEIARFLMAIAEEMKNRNSKRLTGETITKITGIIDFISSNSIYRRILDEDIILEEEIGETGRIVNFTYENFMEYVMAKHILEQWRGRNDEVILDEFEELGNHTQYFENLYGVIDYLIIMMERTKNLQMAMLQKASEWRTSFLDSISILDDVPENTFDILMRFSMSENISLRHRVAEILRKFIESHPDECMKIIEKLAESPDERTEQIIIPYLVALARSLPEKAFCLLESLNHSLIVQTAIEDICPLCIKMALDMIRRWDRYRILDNESWIRRLLLVIAWQQPDDSIQLLNELKNSCRFSPKIWEITIIQILEQESSRRKWFIETFCEENDSQIHKVFVWCLNDLINQNDEEIFLTLMKWSELENPWYREISGGLLGKINESKIPRILPVLRKLCHDKNVRVRISVCNSLVEIMKFDPIAAYRLFLEMLQEEDSGDPIQMSEAEREVIQLDSKVYEVYKNYFSLENFVIASLWDIWRSNPENVNDIFGPRESLISLVKRSISDLPNEIAEKIEGVVPREIEKDVFADYKLLREKKHELVVTRELEVGGEISYVLTLLSLYCAFLAVCSTIDYWFFDIGILKFLNISPYYALPAVAMPLVIILFQIAELIYNRTIEYEFEELPPTLHNVEFIWKEVEVTKPVLPSAREQEAEMEVIAFLDRDMEEQLGLEDLFGEEAEEKELDIPQESEFTDVRQIAEKAREEEIKGEKESKLLEWEYSAEEREETEIPDIRELIKRLKKEKKDEEQANKRPRKTIEESKRKGEIK